MSRALAYISLEFVNHFCLDEGKERYMVAPNSLEDPRVKELCDVSLDISCFVVVEQETFLCTILFQREKYLNDHAQLLK